jgi:hypothetical protein
MFFMGVNTLFNALMNTPGFERAGFLPLVATVGGGMAVQARSPSAGSKSPAATSPRAGA